MKRGKKKKKKKRECRGRSIERGHENEECHIWLDGNDRLYEEKLK